MGGRESISHVVALVQSLLVSFVTLQLFLFVIIDNSSSAYCVFLKSN